MKKTFLTLLLALVSMSLLAVGNGSGTTRRNAIDFNWYGNAEQTVGSTSVTRWYSITVDHLKEMENPTLTLYLTNTSATSAAQVEVKLYAGNSTDELASRTLTINAGQFEILSRNIAIIKNMDITSVVISMKTTGVNGSVVMSASKSETSRLDNACESSQEHTLVPGGAAESGVAGQQNWYHVDLTPYRRTDQKVMVTITPSSAATITTDMAFDCPCAAAGRMVHVAAPGNPVVLTVSAAVLRVIYPFHAFFGVRSSADYTVQVTAAPDQVDGIVASPAPVNYDWTSPGMTIQDGGSWFAVEYDSVADLLVAPQVKLTAPAAATVAAQIAFKNEVGEMVVLDNYDWSLTATKRTFTLDQSLLNSLDPTIFANQKVYYHITSSQTGSTFCLLRKKPATSGECGDAIDFDEDDNEGYTATTQDEYAESLIEVEVSNLLVTADGLPHDVLIYVKNLSATESNTIKAAFVNCGSALTDDSYRSRELAPNEEQVTRVPYSQLKAFNNSIFVMVKASAAYHIYAVRDNNVVATLNNTACASAAEYDWNYGHLQAGAAGNVWYHVLLDTLANVGNVQPHLVIMNRSTSAATIALEYAYECPIVKELGAPEMVTLAAGQTFDKKLSREQLLSLQDDEMWIHITSAQDIFWQLQLTDNGSNFPSAVCTEAIDFNWMIGNDYSAGQPAWYRVDLAYAKAGEKTIQVHATNNGDEVVNVHVDLAFECPCSLSELTSYDFTVNPHSTRPAEGSEKGRIPYSMYHENDAVWIRVTADKNVHLWAEVFEPAQNNITDCLPANGATQIHLDQSFALTQAEEWFYYETQELIDASYVPLITVTNTLSTPMDVTAEVTFECPVTSEMMSRHRTLNAGETVTYQMERDVVQNYVTKYSTAYLHLIAEAGLEYIVTLADPNNGNDCLHAVPAPQCPESMKQGAGETWYKLDLSQIKGKQMTAYMENIAAGTNTISLDVYFDCEGASVGQATRTVGAGATFEREIGEFLAALVPDEVFLCVTTTDSIMMKLCVGDDLPERAPLGKCDDEFVEFEPNHLYQQNAGEDVWYKVDIKHLDTLIVGNPLLLIDNELTQWADYNFETGEYTTGEVLSACGDVQIDGELYWDCNSKSYPTTKSMTIKNFYKRVMEHGLVSFFPGTDYVIDSTYAYIHLHADNCFQFMLAGETNEGNDCETAMLAPLCPDSVIQHAGEMWYKLPVQELKGKQVTAYMANISGRKETITVDVYYRCDGPSVGQATRTVSAGATFEREIGSFLTAVTAEYIYLRVVSTDLLSLKLCKGEDLPIEPIDVCDHEFVDFEPNHLYYQSAGEDVWYRIDIKHLDTLIMGDPVMLIDTVQTLWAAYDFDTDTYTTGDTISACGDVIIDAELYWSCNSQIAPTRKSMTIKSFYERVIAHEFVSSVPGQVQNLDSAFAYVHVTADTCFQFMLAAKTNVGEDCAHAILAPLCPDSVIQHAGEAWYKLPVKDVKGKDVMAYMANISGGQETITVDVYYSCVGPSIGQVTRTVGAGATFERKIGEYISAITAEYIFLRVQTTDVISMKLCVGDDLPTEPIDVCDQEFVDFEPNHLYYQSAGEEVWYRIDIKHLDTLIMGNPVMLIDTVQTTGVAYDFDTHEYSTTRDTIAACGEVTIDAELYWSCNSQIAPTRKSMTIKSFYERMIAHAYVNGVPGYDLAFDSAYAYVHVKADTCFQFMLAAEIPGIRDLKWYECNYIPANDTTWFRVSFDPLKEAYAAGDTVDIVMTLRTILDRETTAKSVAVKYSLDGENLADFDLLPKVTTFLEDTTRILDFDLLKQYNVDLKDMYVAVTADAPAELCLDTILALPREIIYDSLQTTLCVNEQGEAVFQDDFFRYDLTLTSDTILRDTITFRDGMFLKDSVVYYEIYLTKLPAEYTVLPTLQAGQYLQYLAADTALKILYEEVNPTSQIDTIIWRYATDSKTGTYQTVEKIADVHADTAWVAIEAKVDGCETILRDTVGIHVEPALSFADTICAGDSMKVTLSDTDIRYYKTPGETIDTIKCADLLTDSVLFIVNLTVNQPTSYEFTKSICAAQTFTFNGRELSETGIYYDTIPNVAGCDSTIVLHLEVGHVDTVASSLTICQMNLPYTWTPNVQVLPQVINVATDNDYYAHLSRADGECDSIVYKLSLHIDPSTYNTDDPVTVCSEDLPYNWRGHSLTAAGIYYDTIQSGCGIINSVVLSVTPIARKEYTITRCQGDAPYAFNGYTFTHTEDKTFRFDCDSIVTIHFTLNASYSISMTHTICDNEAPYMWRGQSLTATGTYYDRLTTVAGCDSIYELNLIVFPTAETLVERTICKGEMLPVGQGGAMEAVTASGDYVVNLQTSHGCDSVVTYRVIVLSEPANVAFGDLEVNPQFVCGSEPIIKPADEAVRAYYATHNAPNSEQVVDWEWQQKIGNNWTALNLSHDLYEGTGDEIEIRLVIMTNCGNTYITAYDAVFVVEPASSENTYEAAYLSLVSKYNDWLIMLDVNKSNEILKAVEPDSLPAINSNSDIEIVWVECVGSVDPLADVLAAVNDIAKTYGTIVDPSGFYNSHMPDAYPTSNTIDPDMILKPGYSVSSVSHDFIYVDDKDNEKPYYITSDKKDGSAPHALTGRYYAVMVIPDSLLEKDCQVVVASQVYSCNPAPEGLPDVNPDDIQGALDSLQNLLPDLPNVPGFNAPSFKTPALTPSVVEPGMPIYVYNLNPDVVSTITVIDAMGERLDVKMTEGHETAVYTTPNILPGCYLLNISSSEINHSMRFIVK